MVHEVPSNSSPSHDSMNFGLRGKEERKERKELTVNFGASIAPFLQRKSVDIRVSDPLCVPPHSAIVIFCSGGELGSLQALGAIVVFWV